MKLATSLAAAAEYKLNISSLRTLIILEKRDITVGTIAKELDLTPASATQIADSLVRMDFVTRNHGEQDRRIIWISINDRGRAALKDITSALPV